MKTSKPAKRKRKKSAGTKPADIQVPVAHSYYTVKPREKATDWVGTVSFKEHTIRIADTVRCEHAWANAFWHEFWHAAFHELGYESDSDNEAKVEAHAHVMLRLCADPHGKALLKDMVARL